MREIDQVMFAARRADAPLVIDVREPEEYAAGHVPGARLVPMGAIHGRLDELPADVAMYVICASGNRSLSVADQLAERGIDAWSVAGGTGAWAQAGRPIVTGTSPRTASPTHLTDRIGRPPSVMFDIDIIETPSLGDRSYLLSDGTAAAVIDPQRDIDRILDLATSRDVRITHVLETHLHNDYVSGGVELAPRPARLT